MRFLKPILVAAAAAGVVAAGAATSFAVTGPDTSSTANLTNTSTASGATTPQLNTSAAGAAAAQSKAGESAAQVPDGRVPMVSSNGAGGGAAVTRQNAIDFVLGQAADAKLVSAERVQSPVGPVWTIRLTSNGSDVKYMVNATTGKMLGTAQPVATGDKNSTSGTNSDGADD